GLGWPRTEQARHAGRRPAVAAEDAIDLLGRRLRAQRLAPRHGDGVAGLVRALCGVQAQDPTAAALAVRARTLGLRAAEIERARAGERSIVRTWVMRGTLHLVAAEDVRWLLGLL